MKNFRIYMLVVVALAISIISFLLSGANVSKAASSDKDVTVVNTASNPVPVSPQGTTTVTGTVSISNLPNSIVTLPAGTPITLRQTLGLAGPINSVEHVRLFNTHGDTHINGQIAIGSISIAAVASGNPGEISYDFGVNNCSGNGFGDLRTVVAQTGTTSHLDFPIPQMAPETGPASPFCIDVTVLNGNHAENIDITLVGSIR
jgi:hypothetical protein